MVGCLHNKQENIDQKSGKDRYPYPYTLSLYLIRYFFVQEIFTRNFQF